MAVRYSLLTYMYTLFYHAHTKGETVMRALAWEFPDDASLRETFNQFLLGPSILVTPVLEPNVDYVKGVFPGIGQGERWYDWYTLQEVDAQPGENVTLSAPLEHINVHVRGGSVIARQQPKLTTGATRRTPYSLLVTLGENDDATGDLYLDDGESLVPNATRVVQVTTPFRYLKQFPSEYPDCLSPLTPTVLLLQLVSQLHLLRLLPRLTAARKRHHRGLESAAIEHLALLRRQGLQRLADCHGLHRWRVERCGAGTVHARRRV